MKTVLATLLALAICACAHAPAASDADRAALIALDDAWIAAEAAHDRATLERVLDERFTATNSSGQTVDRAAYIDWVLSEPVEPFTVVHERIDVRGDTATIVVAAPDGSRRFTWTAVKREGRWRALSDASTPAPAH